jgi:hypothetical protein
MVMEINEMSAKQLNRAMTKLNKKLAPYFEGQLIINKIWHEYSEDTPVGELLRRRDKVRLQLHKLENGGNGKKGEAFRGTEGNT